MTFWPLQERRESCRNEPAFNLAVLYTCGFFGFLLRLTFVDIPLGNKEMINQIIPILGVIQAGIVQYFYQKSKDLQQEKQAETIKALATTAQTTATTAAAAAGVPLDKLPTPAHQAPIPSGHSDTKVDTMNVTADTVNTSEKKD